MTRTVKAPDEMIRFVLDPEGTVVPDLRARLPGRGAWVTATRGCVAEAARRGLFRRAFKRPGSGKAPGESPASDRAANGVAKDGITWPADLPEAIEAALLRDLRGALALANKAGAVVTGFTKVEAALGSPAGIAALLHAREASADGRRKLAAALRRRGPDAISAIPVIDDLSNDELGVALGRDHVIHAALVAGAGSAGCLARWRRLRAYRGEVPPDASGPGLPDGGPHDPGDGPGQDGAGRGDAGVDEPTSEPSAGGAVGRIGGQER